MRLRPKGVRAIGAAAVALSIAVISIPAVSSALSTTLGSTPAAAATTTFPNLLCTAPTIYDMPTNGEVYSVNTTTSATSHTNLPTLGPGSGADLNAFAVSSDGSTVFAANFTPSGGTTTVYKYVLGTGVQTTVANMPATNVDEVIAGGVDPVNGDYYYGGWNSSTAGTVFTLFAFNPTTDTAVEVGTIARPETANFVSGDLTFDTSGNLYILAGKSVTGGYEADLVSVAGPLPASGTGPLTGNLVASFTTVSTQVYDGIAFGANSVLYASSESGTFSAFNANTKVVTPLTSLGSNSWADMGSCTYNGSLTVEKNIVGARAVSTDEFTMTINSGTTQLATATTAGDNPGLQTQVAGPIVGLPSTTYTATETAAAGANLSNYASSWVCLNGGAPFSSSTGNSTTLSVAFPSPVGSAGAQIVCTFTNSSKVPGLTTSVNGAASGPVGTSWTDSATVAGNATGGVPTGTVAWTLCTETSGPCTGGTAVSSTATSTATGDSSAFGPSSSVTPGAVGTYCFNASYTPTGGSFYLLVAQQTDSECFTVTAATPGISTTITPPGTSGVGNLWSDSATVTGNSTGGDPSGTLAFTWCKEATVGTGCTGITGGGTLTTNAPSGGTNSTTWTSSGATPTTVGTYCFNAAYTATAGGNYASISEPTGSECFPVSKAGSTTTTQQSVTTSGPASIVIGATGSASDTVTVTGNATGGAPSGSVTFSYCFFATGGNQLCPSGTQVGAGPVTLAAVPTTHTSSATSTTIPLTQIGTYCFAASYLPDGTSNYLSSTDNMTGLVDTNECVTVTQATPSFTTSINGPGTGPVGTSWTDSAIVGGNATGLAPTGTVAWTLCKETSGPCTGGTAVSSTGTSTPSGNNSTFGPSSSVTPGTVGTYCFNAAYTATVGGNYADAGPQSDNECFTVSAAGSSIATQQSTSGSINLGGSITDAATVTGNSAGGAPSGSVNFTVCGPMGSNATCSSGTGVGSAASLSPVTDTDTSTAMSASFTPPAVGTYCFAAVYAPDPSANYLTSSDNVSGDVRANECFLVTEPDFRVTKTDTAGNGNPVVPGATIPYSVLIENIGDGGGSAVVTDTLASNLTMNGTPACGTLSGTDTCTVANPSGSTWTFSVTLAAGDQVSVTFNATVSSTDSGDVVNTATITTGNCDNGTASAASTPNAAVNNCSSTVTNSAPDFTVTKTATTPNPLNPGSTINYSIAIKNVGDGAGTATVSDDVPSSLTVQGTPVCAVTAPDTCIVTSSGTTWNFAVNLAAGDTATVTYAAVVASSATGAVANTATITTGPCNTSSACSSTSSDPVTPVATAPATVAPTTTTTTTAPKTAPSTAATIAFTGADIAGMATGGLALIGLGGLLLLVSRRRRNATGELR